MHLAITVFLIAALIYQLLKMTLIIFCFRDAIARLKCGNESWVNDFIIQSQLNDGISLSNAKRIDLSSTQWTKLSLYRKAYCIMSLSGLSLISTLVIWIITDTILYSLSVYFQ